MSSRVMIVEDDAIVAAHLERAVTRMGYAVVGLLAAGEEVVAQLKESSPDVVLLDIRLRGEMTGLEAAAQIRQVSDVPVIYLSAYAEDDYIQKATATQAYGFLTKPVRDKELRASIEVALYKARTDRTLSQLNRVLRAIREINKLITTEDSAPRLLEHACEALVRTQGFVRVHFVPAVEGELPAVSAGADRRGVGIIVPQDTGDAHEVQPFVTALRTGQACIVQDVGNDARLAPWREELQIERTSSAAAFLVQRDERTFGALCLHSSRTQAFGEEDVDLLVELCADLALALQGMDERAARAQAEAALWEREQRFRAVFDAATDIIFVKDESLRYVEVNQAAGRPFGASPTEILGSSDTDLFGAEAAAEMRSTDELVLRGQISNEEVTRIILGQSHVFHMIKVPLRSPEGEVIGLCGIARDITSRLAVEMALRESEERFRSFVENTAIGIYRTTPDGRVVMANLALARILGLPSVEAVMQLNLEERARTGAYDRRAFVEAVEEQRALKGFETRWTRADGGEVPVREYARAVRDPSGATLFYEGTVEDLTTQRTLEAQLVQAQKMEAIGRLAGGVAHDFNNLLQAMMTHAELLLAHSEEPGKVLAHGTEIEQNLRRGAALTRQLLLFSRQETVRPERLDINGVIRSAAELLRRLVRENVAFRLDLADGSLDVDADHGQLDQVLMNLVVNASDAMQDGGTLTITSAGRGADVALSVSDTGHGMTPEVAERIFEPFFTTKALNRGTGLGLSVVHGIVSRHGGSIEVASAPGRGSTFTITLPMAASGFFRLTAGATAGSEPLDTNGHGERVLLVEDEQGAREGLTEILTMLGYEVVAVGCGEDAGTLPAEPAFDLVISDLMLPGVSGPDLVAGLEDRWTGLKVILMSGYTEDDVLRRTVTAGRARFLQKPFDIDTLAREVRAVLDDQNNDRTRSSLPASGHGQQ